MKQFSSRTAVINTLLAVVVVAGLGLALAALTGDASRLSEPVTAQVERGTVVGTVAASGQVIAPADVDVNFAVAGEVASVLADVGDAVQAGQVLARLDDTAFREQLDVAKAGVVSAEAGLAQLVSGPTPQQNQLAQVQREQAYAQLEQAEAARDHARQMRDLNVASLDEQVSSARRQRDRAEDAANAARDARQAACAADPDAAACQQARQADIEARGRRDESRVAVDTAERAREQGLLGEQRTLDQADERVRDAELAVRLADAQQAVSTTPTAAERAQAQAQLAQAQAQFAQAQRDLDRAELSAPYDGVIASRGLQLGDLVGPSVGPNAEGFVVTNLGEREISVLFSEADATRIETGQRANVTFDALADVSAVGEVRRVAYTATVTGNLVQYEVRVTVDRWDDRIRTGQTATVEVVTGESSDTLFVPSSAVRVVGGQASVIVFDGERETVREVDVGIRGDVHTELVSGVREGERVILPTQGSSTLPFGPGGRGGPGGPPGGS